MPAETIDKRIISFIHQHHIFTLATAAGNQPYACTCFYVFIDSLNLFVFTSDEGTRHVAEMKAQKRVAGTVALETNIIGRIRGIQFTGDSFLLEGDRYAQAKRAYLKRFPYAGFKELTLWGIEPDFIKMTHNMLGFGTKLIWTKKNDPAF